MREQDPKAFPDPDDRGAKVEGFGKPEAGVGVGWIGSCRRELLDHVIALNEEHLRRLIRDYVRYYHEDRIHDSLGKDTPNQRSVETKSAADESLIALPRLGGLHHRYAWRRAA